MPTVRLEFDLDSEVYPELHAALDPLQSPQARAERLRQLAAAGLVWEKVRIHGPLAAALAAMPAEAAEAAPAAPAPPSRKPASGRRAPVKAPPVTSTPARPVRVPSPAAPPSSHAAFVDLAIDAEPEVPDMPDVSEVEQFVRALPVLLDEVPPGRVMTADDVAERRADAQALSNAAPWPTAAEPGEGLADARAAAREEDRADDRADHAPHDLHLTALVNKPATRSRLMRMKDRGLFKNG